MRVWLTGLSGYSAIKILILKFPTFTVLLFRQVTDITNGNLGYFTEEEAHIG